MPVCTRNNYSCDFTRLPLSEPVSRCRAVRSVPKSSMFGAEASDEPLPPGKLGTNPRSPPIRVERIGWVGQLSAPNRRLPPPANRAVGVLMQRRRSPFEDEPRSVAGFRFF